MSKRKKMLVIAAAFLVIVGLFIGFSEYSSRIVSQEETVTDFGQTICTIETLRYSAALIETKDSEILVAYTQKFDPFHVMQAYVPMSELPEDDVWASAFRYVLSGAAEVETFTFE